MLKDTLSAKNTNMAYLSKVQAVDVSELKRLIQNFL